MTQPNGKPQHKPSRVRFSLFVFCFVYPLVTALLYILAPLTAGWSLWQRNLVMVPLIVVAMVYVIIPFIQKRMGRWL
jgi:antibiotic biosynthesis monooxygenase (ABM) superfamily enzyme